MNHPPPPSALLPIGAFSNATQLSAKALRLYAEHGILPPARIDAETGYRYYRPEQVHEARLVRLLRELDMPLATIAKLLVHPTTLEVPLKRHMDMLSQRHSQQQTAYYAALALLRPARGTTVTAVLERTLPAMDVITQSFEADSKTLLIRAHILLAQLGVAIGKDFLNSEAAFISLPAPLLEQEEIPLELCVPIANPAGLPSTYAIRHCPAQALACVSVSAGESANWVAASDALFDWFDRTGVSIGHAPLIFIRGHALELAWPIL